MTIGVNDARKKFETDLAAVDEILARYAFLSSVKTFAPQTPDWVVGNSVV